MKKRLALLLIVFLLFPALSGCSEQKVTDGPVTFTLDGETVPQLSVCNLPGDNAGFIDAAALLADRIMRKSTVTPTIGKFDANASFQIVITDAEKGNSYLPEGITVDAMQYAICRNGNSIFVIAHDEMGAELGAQSITDAMQGTNSVELNDLCTQAVTYTYGQNLKLESEAEYRIMTYNIERTELGGDGRQEYALNCIQFYNPDVVGFQEYCTDYTAKLTPKLKENGYSMVAEEVVTTEGQAPGADRYSMTNNYTPIAYKTERFDLLDSGWERIVPANYNNYGWTGYSITWAVLKDKATGDIFAVTSHHNLASSNEDAVDTRTQALVKVVNLVRNTIIANYNCPVFCVGDYNTKETNGDYRAMLSQPEFSDARYVAELGYSVGNSHGSKGKVICSGSTEETIDHILVVGDTRVLRHRFGHSTTAVLASDHKPVFVDVIIGEAPKKINSTNPFRGLFTMHINQGIAE